MTAAPYSAAESVPARVLLAEDDERVRRMLTRLLSKRHCVVTGVNDGEAALEETRRNPPDIAIVDLGLPKVNGFDVVEQIKQQFGTDISVLVLSGLDDPESRVRAFEAGADDFIAKPVHIAELSKRLDAFRRTQLAYREIQQAHQRIERLRVYAAEASALLAHDLNNGLFVATTNLEYLSEEPDEDEERADAMSGTLRALRRMSGLVQNFVDLGRMEDAALVPEREMVDFVELLHGSVALYNHEAHEKRASILVECADSLIADPDPTLIERVVHNLLGNAVRYVSPGGAVRVRASFDEISDADDFDRVLVVEIGNTGVAIPDAVRQTLFEKYAKGREQAARRGMGLYFCRMACEVHGGSIALESEGEYATNFVVRLPVHVATSVARSRETAVVAIEELACAQ